MLHTDTEKHTREITYKNLWAELAQDLFYMFMEMTFEPLPTSDIKHTHDVSWVAHRAIYLC